MTNSALAIRSDAHLQLRSVIHILGVLDNLIVRQMLEGLLPGQAHHLPERHGEGPDAARACVPVLKFLNIITSSRP